MSNFAQKGNRKATTAFRAASRLLRREGSEFDLLCVGPEFYFPKGKAGKTANKTSRMVEDYDQRIRAEARRHLIRAQAMLATFGVEALMRMEVGSPARVIVIGATGEDDLKHDLLGSVSTKVTQAAPCSTLVVKL